MYEINNSAFESNKMTLLMLVRFYNYGRVKAEQGMIERRLRKLEIQNQSLKKDKYLMNIFQFSFAYQFTRLFYYVSL